MKRPRPCTTCAPEPRARASRPTPASDMRRRTPRPVLQAKGSCPTCDAPDAPAEREADRVAAASSSASSAPISIREAPRGGEPDPATRTALESRAGGGAPLPDVVRQRLEPRLATDLSDVRVHADGASHRLTTALGARALTYGSNIYFQQGAYDPDGARGRDTLAHEVAHTVQQRRSGLALQRDVGDREAVPPRPTFGTGLGMDPGETRTWALVADRRDASAQTDFELSLELAAEREETLRSEIEADPDSASNEQIERLMRLHALRLMAEHREVVRAARDVDMAALNSVEAETVLTDVRLAASQLRHLRWLRRRVELEAHALHVIGSGALRAEDDDRELVRAGFSHAVDYGRHPFETRHAREAIADAGAELRRGATRGRKRALLIHLATTLEAERTRQAPGLEAAAHEIVMRFPFLAALSDEEIGVPAAESATFSGAPPSAIESMARAPLGARMRSAYSELLEHVDVAIRRIGSGETSVWDLPLVVQGVRAQLPASAASAIDRASTVHHIGNLAAELGWSALQVGLVFVPVIGPALSAVVGVALVAGSVRDMIDRYALTRASLEEDDSLLGAGGPAAADWVFLAIDVVLTAWDIAEVGRVLRGVRGAARGMGELASLTTHELDDAAARVEWDDAASDARTEAAAARWEDAVDSGTDVRSLGTISSARAEGRSLGLDGMAASSTREAPRTRMTGAGTTDVEDARAPALYEVIRGDRSDVAAIARELGIAAEIVQRAKNHLFIMEHVIPATDGPVRARFQPVSRYARAWTSVAHGSATVQDRDFVRDLITHEYVESVLHERGMPVYDPLRAAEDSSIADAGAHSKASVAEHAFRDWRVGRLTPQQRETLLYPMMELALDVRGTFTVQELAEMHPEARAIYDEVIRARRARHP